MYERADSTLPSYPQLGDAFRHHLVCSLRQDDGSTLTAPSNDTHKAVKHILFTHRDLYLVPSCASVFEPLWTPITAAAGCTTSAMVVKTLRKYTSVSVTTPIQY